MKVKVYKKRDNEITRRYLQGETQTRLALLFGISPQRVGQIIQRRLRRLFIFAFWKRERDSEWARLSKVNLRSNRAAQSNGEFVLERFKLFIEETESK